MNKIIDLFSGCGGLSLGFEMAGFETIAAIDNWKDAIITFNHNSKNNPGLCIDITEFNNVNINDILKNNSVIGVVGGPPCQGYSSARLSDNSEKILKINEERNLLYLEFFKSIKKIKPEFFVMENVRGLVSMNDGIFVKDIKERFSKIGYKVNYEILNAANYGVPQNRQRVFFIGLKDNYFKFPKAKKFKVTINDALSDLPVDLDKFDSEKYVSGHQNKYQKIMRKGSIFIHNNEKTRHEKKTIDIISKIPEGGGIKDLEKSYWNVRKFNKSFQRMNRFSQSLTIDTGHRNYFHYEANRVPTARESARIQSFPDKFKFLGSKTSQYVQIGNAIPPLLAYEIAKSIKNQIRIK